MAKIRSVCFVDDSPGMRKLGSSMLAQEDIEVFTAADGYEALHVIRDQSPDACFIDLEMPNINGLQLVSLLRNWSGWKNKPLAILSSASSPFDKQKGLLAGADIYLTKPFTRETITNAIADLGGYLDE